MNFFPVKTTVVKHSVRDITFILPQSDPEVGYLAANYEKRPYLSSIDQYTKRIYGVNDISKPEMRELVKFKIEK